VSVFSWAYVYTSLLLLPIVSIGFVQVGVLPENIKMRRVLWPMKFAENAELHGLCWEQLHHLVTVCLWGSRVVGICSEAKLM